MKRKGIDFLEHIFKLKINLDFKSRKIYPEESQKFQGKFGRQLGTQGIQIKYFGLMKKILEPSKKRI
jgi:hypothetical protein